MKKYLALITFLSFNLIAKTCSIDLFPELVFVDSSLKDISTSEVFERNDCSKSISKRVLEILIGTSGRVPAKYLNQRLKETHQSATINLHPASIQISKISSKLKGYFKNDLDFKKVKSMDGKKLIKVSQGEKINFKCNKCEETGNTSLAMILTDAISGESRRYNFSANISKSFNALVAKNDLSPFQNLGDLAEQFELGRVSDNASSNYFKNKEKLKYYKLNKSIKRGASLKFSDLSPKTLVRAGSTINVKLSAKTLMISTKAQAQKSGKFGDVIELRNPKTKKIITGKVQGPNMVVVEL